MPPELLAAVEAAQRAAEQPSTVKVDGNVSVFVSIKHPSLKLEPVEQSLEQIVKCVRGLVEKFNPLV